MTGDSSVNIKCLDSTRLVVHLSSWQLISWFTWHLTHSTPNIQTYLKTITTRNTCTCIVNILKLKLNVWLATSPNKRQPNITNKARNKKMLPVIDDNHHLLFTAASGNSWKVWINVMTSSMKWPAGKHRLCELIVSILWHCKISHEHDYENEDYHRHLMEKNHHDEQIWLKFLKLTLSWKR